jgi:tight adherence protein C
MDQYMLPIAVLGAFGAVLGIGVFIAFELRQRAEVRDALRQLDEYQIENVREQQMLAPAADRLVKPIIERLARITGRFTPAGYTDTVRHKLEIAGNPAGIDVDRFLAFKVFGALAIPFWIWFIPSMAKIGGFIGILAIGALSFGSFQAVDLIVNRRIADRQKDISRRLPDVLDLLVISVEAGLGFEQAIDRTIASVPGALSDELRRAMQEIRVGSTRAEALRALDERCEVPELRGFVLAILQADTFGVSIGRVLRAQADEMRIKRRQKAQEKAMKAPVKMLFPLLFCIFPSLFVIILGPAAIQISTSL